eukprot:TRINITY_DN10909_c0_g1_i1.p1 TRINITY_DN10909_c0_g1~~TRINITY_DN10909_c0_g1_i1.p1  ORF type:complete len:245 (-),score=42.95 TRINITY_DN10909_c0_g1_i1:41-775(-)
MHEPFVSGPGRPKSNNSPLLIVLCILVVVCISLQAYIIVNMEIEKVEEKRAELFPINMNVCKENIRAYRKSQYEEDVSVLTARWTEYYKEKELGKKDVVIFDIDDTVLSNYGEMEHTDFGYIPKLWDEWVETLNATAIPQTKEFFLRLIKLKYTVILITGRSEHQREATEANLEKEGLVGYERLIMKQPSDHGKTALVYKEEARTKLVKEGWNIVGSCGDQLSDIYGDYTPYKMKVPNFCYYIP